MTTIHQYLQIVERAWNDQDGYVLAELLSLRDKHAQNTTLHVSKPENSVERILSPPLDEIVILHLKSATLLGQGNIQAAYNTQSTMTTAFTKMLQAQKEENWMLPMMYTICLDLRLLATRCEAGAPGPLLEKAAEGLMGCFRVCAADNRSSDRDTKRLGMLLLVNQLFKVYFRINKLHLCKPLIRAIESSSFKDQFPLAQQITYKYFVGRKAMFDSDYKMADEYLSYAFERCHREAKQNKRLILIYLAPVKMLLGLLPTRQVLEKYDLLPFWEVATAVREGDIKQLDKVIKDHERFFISSGVYLIVAKLKVIAYRNLFKKVYLILQTHQIPVQSLQDALHLVGQSDVDVDETQCIVANLIHEGKIKGYISYQHQKLVVSKQNPFPLLSSIS
ncbi:PCI domain-containing protein 2 homolog [Ctenocephalides felis]|uniref:PCI domain-containing protein 2 homolog n=1 Tax=Ctenocephalides felis TaxID=7515 RepID=UPI000E6E1754|nr:PCI domain-containing protein 2 homolog [Ctenocephalides felis]